MEMMLAENIRRFRKERGLTQEQLSEVLGVTAGAVYKWEARLSLPELSRSASRCPGMGKPLTLGMCSVASDSALPGRRSSSWAQAQRDWSWHISWVIGA